MTEPGTEPRREGKRAKGRGKGQRGERLMVPRAEFRSYYGRPVLKAPVWKTPDVPGYLFFGGLSGASSVLAAFAQAAGNPQLARNAKVASTAAIAISAVALVNDLGRPARFLNMLRVFKTSSPMSVGSWLLAAYGPVSGAAAASAVTGRLPRAGAAATAGAAVLGSGIATYTAALICDTAVPAWHDGHREMPYLFAGSATSAAGGLGMLTAPSAQTGQAARFAALGAATELAAKHLMMHRLGDIAEPYHAGRPGRLLRAAEGLTVAGLAGSVVASSGRSRSVSQVASRAAGLALVAASALTRFGVFEAGLASARDPGYTVRPQRERADQARATTLAV
jgi:formate-dependent nitrite reductase membrane component NrfD